MRRTIGTCSLALVMSLGCGGDGDGGGSASGVDGSQLLTAISDADAQAFCRLQEREYKSQLPSETLFCTFFSDDASSPALCESNRDQCIAEGTYDEEVAEDWECEEETAAELFDEVEGECTATAGEYEACIRASMRAWTDAMKRASCENATGDGDSEGDESLPEACKTLFDKCPNVYID